MKGLKPGKFQVKMTFNDKHQQKPDQGEFARTSEEFIIHPKYDQTTGNNNDLCLVKVATSLDLITGNSPTVQGSSILAKSIGN